LAWIGGVLGICALGLYIFYKLYVGAVNVPVSEYSHDISAVSQQINVPDGFSVSIFAEDVPNARLMQVTRNGDLLVANPNLNQIILLQADHNGDGRTDAKRLLLEGLKGPNGMDFHEGWLYVAETDAIGRIAFDHQAGQVTGAYERIVTGLPGGENHWKKTLRFGPDGLMYLTVGSSCNVCLEADERRATMMRYQPDGSGEEIFARGLRNSAGFDWSPVDGAIYATDNGRDLLGDDFPPCELNRVEEGRHYGWPFVNGDNIPDPDFGEGNESYVGEAIPPVHGFRAHNAPLGIVFLTHASWPAEYRHAAIVALHGSWNRSRKDGYKVVSLHWLPNGRIEERDFMTGFLKDDTAFGRPAEVAEGADGSLYIADDYAGVIYRVKASADPLTETVVEMATRDSDSAYDIEETLAVFDADSRSRLVMEGEALYQKFDCQTCHAPEAENTVVLENLGSRYNLEKLDAMFRAPVAPMPAFPLTDTEIKSLSVYLLSVENQP